MGVNRCAKGGNQRSHQGGGGETGEIAAALITGERGGITGETNQAMRDSGLFHILPLPICRPPP
jgi:predicted membrane metal-binding protein